MAFQKQTAAPDHWKNSEEYIKKGKVVLVLN
jgi:hypothetical protein